MKPFLPSELTPEQSGKILEFLQNHPVGVLATVDAQGDPSATTIYFSVEQDLSVTFTTKEHTQKHENIERHNKVMLAVYEAESQTAVQISGTAKEITDKEEVHNTFLGTVHAAKQTGPDNVPPISKIPGGKYVAYRISPDAVHLSEYGWGDNLAKAIEIAKNKNEENTEDPA